MVANTDYVHTKEFFNQDVMVDGFTSQLFINHNTVLDTGSIPNFKRNDSLVVSDNQRLCLVSNKI